MPLNKQDQEKLYDEIIKIYDVAEAMLIAIERENNPGPEFELRVTRPIIRQIEESMPVLEESYMNFLEGGQKAKPRDVRAIEDALRSIFIKCDEFLKEFDKLPKKQGT